MNKYELFLILPGTITENDAESLIQKLKITLQETGAVISDVEALGKMKISYPIRHIRYGYFYNIIFEVEKEQLNAIKDKLRVDENFLRAMIKKFNAEARQERKNLRKKEEEARSSGFGLAAAAPSAQLDGNKTGDNNFPKDSQRPEDAAPSVPAAAPKEKLNEEELAKLDQNLDKILEKEFIEKL